MQRITEGFGTLVEEQRCREAEQVAARPLTSEAPPEALIPADDPLHGQANISTDGGMMLIRDEGWREFKLTAISAVRPRTPEEPLLERHSYQAGLWQADEMEPHQYIEGLRRRITQVEVLSSVNDAAPWIERITSTNFPAAEHIVDWHHAADRLSKVGETVFGADQSEKEEWVNVNRDALWQGKTEVVIDALDELALHYPSYPPEVRQAPGYFRNHYDKMDYPFYRDAGYPIGSGTVESGINTVVHHRMRRQGRGWCRDNGHAMLAALSALHSDRFEASWQSVFADAA